MISISTGTEAHKPLWPDETRPDCGSDGHGRGDPSAAPSPRVAPMTDGIALGRSFAGRLNRLLTETAWPPAADIWLKDLIR
jgi:hypothetical protein